MSTGMGEVSSLLRKPEKHQQREATKEKNIPRHRTFGPLANKTFDGFYEGLSPVVFLKGERYIFKSPFFPSFVLFSFF